MPADRKQVEGLRTESAVTTLESVLNLGILTDPLDAAALSLLLTDHGAQSKDIDALHEEVVALRAEVDRERARAEAAETVIEQVELFSRRPAGDILGLLGTINRKAKKARAAHQQPATVKAGETR